MEQKKLNRLRVIIAEKNLTNKWLSEQLGVGQATISKWVQNNAQPNLEMLIKISKLLNVDINELIRTDEVHIDAENNIYNIDSKWITSKIPLPLFHLEHCYRCYGAFNQEW